MKIGIACGGTGGHIFPGLAVAEALRQRGHTVVLWLAGKPGEDLALVGWVGTVVTVYARGVSSHAPRAIIATCFRLVRAVLQCRQTMQRFAPDVLLAMGSYASVGPVLAARWLHIPVVLHEANVIPGRAIRFLSRWAEAVAVGFEETRHHFATSSQSGKWSLGAKGTDVTHRRLVVTGMPVRADGRRMTDDGKQTTDDGRPISEIATSPRNGASGHLAPGADVENRKSPAEGGSASGGKIENIARRAQCCLVRKRAVER